MSFTIAVALERVPQLTAQAPRALIPAPIHAPIHAIHVPIHVPIHAPIHTPIRASPILATGTGLHVIPVAPR